MQVLLGAATAGFHDLDGTDAAPFFCCCRVAAFGSQDLALRTWVVAGGQLSLSLAGSAIENAPRTSSDGRTDKVLYI